MASLLVIADDFTGALDTAVQFSKAGIIAKVLTDADCDLQEIFRGAEVVVVDTESRHLSCENAYQAVRKTAETALQSGIKCIYKKTDSALRGNIGAELTAVLDAAHEPVLSFIPAYPEMGRTTRNGIQYIDELPLEKSEFSRDPFEPSTISCVPDIIAKQSNVAANVVPEDQYSPAAEDDVCRIDIYDCTADEQMKKIAYQLKKIGRTNILAGCAGFASVLPEILELKKGNEPRITKGKELFVVSGSLNPVTLRQLQTAEDRGALRLHLTAEQKLAENYWQTENGFQELQTLVSLCDGKRISIVDSSDDHEESREYSKSHGITDEMIRNRIPESLSTIIEYRLRLNNNTVLFIIGGDTLIGFLKHFGVREIEPMTEILPGTVVSEIIIDGRKLSLISKSGGFGAHTLLEDLAGLILSES